jgi:hypothetical protein
MSPAITPGSEQFAEYATRLLATLSARFAAGEAEIADAYFRWDGRNRDTEAHWLMKQVGREIESTFTMLREVMEHVGRDLGKSRYFWVDDLPATIDRKWIEDALIKVRQELNHGNGCLDILEWLTGEPADVRDLVRRYNRWSPDPTVPNNKEWVALAKLFQEQEQRPEPWVRLITSQGLLEGGSCGLFYAASRLSGSELNDRIAAVFKVVLDDERGHGPANVYEVSKVIKTERDLEGAVDMLMKRGLQRLRMRNEQFSHPLSEQRLERIAEGDIDLSVTRDIWGETLYRFISEAGV